MKFSYTLILLVMFVIIQTVYSRTIDIAVKQDIWGVSILKQTVLDISDPYSDTYKMYWNQDDIQELVVDKYAESCAKEWAETLCETYVTYGDSIDCVIEDDMIISVDLPWCIRI